MKSCPPALDCLWREPHVRISRTHGGPPHAYKNHTTRSRWRSRARQIASHLRQCTRQPAHHVHALCVLHLEQVLLFLEPVAWGRALRTRLAGRARCAHTVAHRSAPAHAHAHPIGRCLGRAKIRGITSDFHHRPCRGYLPRRAELSDGLSDRAGRKAVAAPTGRAGGEQYICSTARCAVG
jgi:hypothetical protein